MKEEEEKKNMKTKPHFWRWAVASMIFRLVLIYFPKNLNLATRPEVSTPVTSLRRLAEGYWLTQSSMSPYAEFHLSDALILNVLEGSMYHGSPLLLSVLELKDSLIIFYADFISAMLIRATGLKLRMAYCERLKSLGLGKLFEISGEYSALMSSPIGSFWVGCSISFVSLSDNPDYTCNGPDATPRKLFLMYKKDEADNSSKGRVVNGLSEQKNFSWRPVGLFFVWVFIWTLYTLVLCGIFMRNYGGISEMFNRTYGFILTVKDLSPNIGVLWYFFAEVFEFFRDFFLIVFHVNILFMILPLAIRLKHRPCFLAFVYMAICSILKPYPSVGDSALYLALLALFFNELAEMQFSFFLFCGFVGVSLLSPVMHNLWIWRGTGNANFYFATGMAYACFQIILVVESVSAMLNHDRKIRKLVATT
uniref:GPI transamidase subunit PIG-U n=1 Tax=Solanum lycopersicum TaxID=4081 RepID=A0A3Q7IPW4_SOLLC